MVLKVWAVALASLGNTLKMQILGPNIPSWVRGSGRQSTAVCPLWFWCSSDTLWLPPPPWNGDSAFCPMWGCWLYYGRWAEHRTSFWRPGLNALSSPGCVTLGKSVGLSVSSSIKKRLVCTKILNRSKSDQQRLTGKCSINVCQSQLDIWKAHPQSLRATLKWSLGLRELLCCSLLSLYRVRQEQVLREKKEAEGLARSGLGEYTHGPDVAVPIFVQPVNYKWFFYF